MKIEWKPGVIEKTLCTHYGGDWRGTSEAANGRQREYTPEGFRRVED